jgi:hypothetical protein
MDENLNTILQISDNVISGLEYGDLSKNKVVEMLNELKEEAELAKSQIS